jgi:hypothetical protein
MISGTTPYVEGNPRAFASNRARLTVGKSLIGWANDFSAQESFGNVPIRVFGHAEVQLFETVAYNVSGSFSYMHILTKSLHTLAPDAWFKLPWDGAGNTEANANIISYLGEVLELQDWTRADAPVLKITGFKPEGRVFRLSEGAITMVNCTFVAKTIEEEPGGKA